jgi:putative transposase
MVKKKITMRPLTERRAMIEQGTDMSISHQCEVLQIHRSGLYYTPVPEREENLQLMRMMDEQYFKTPFYGVRKMTEWLYDEGYNVNHKRVKRLMNVMGWQTIYRQPNTSKPDKEHLVFPYLIKGLKISRANQVWEIDITYIPMLRGFMYLCAIIDVHTRYVVNWSISNTMTATWCRQVVEEAIAMHGQPEIINSDQGSQFTSLEYTELLTKREKPILISMDGKGRCLDNIFIERLWRSVKYECVYLYAFEDGIQLYNGLQHYFQFYNNTRIHQSIEYRTPASLYLNEVLNNEVEKAA